MSALSPPTEKIVVAMSGGVDSSVAALLLAQQGHQLVGLTLRLQPSSEDRGEIQAVEQARLAAEHIGISHKTIEQRELFERQVLRYAWDQYAGGRTPNPCTVCNPQIKFKTMIDYAAGIGATRVATGHHARLEIDATCQAPVLLRGKDENKDQSYFLFGLSPVQLDLSLFPIGNLTKDEVRKIARQNGLPNADNPESQDACMAVTETGFAETLRKTFKRPAQAGNIVNSDGQILGKHAGIHGFTIGQRRGLGIALGSRAYVLAIDPLSNEVMVDIDEDLLLSESLLVSNVVWHGAGQPGQPFEAAVQIRYRHQAARATVEPLSGGRAQVHFAQPQKSITPGQAAVFYDAQRVIGGGWIDFPETK
jgi:tRNA-uridine 2-sulfurtransferase